ncbi:hypothetical protein ACW5R3_00385 [Bizionia sp. KMM 8389]
MKHFLILILTLTGFYTTAANNTHVASDTTQVGNEGVLYEVTQDNRYVNINISTVDSKTAMTVIRNGVTVYYDIKGKKKKNVYVKYPVAKGGPRESRQEMQMGTGVEGVDLSSMIEKQPAEAEYGYFDKKQEFNKDLNSLDIAIVSQYSPTNQLFEFSIRIPKVRIDSDADTDFSKLSIGVVTNTRGGADADRSRGQDSGQGMRSGGGRSGGGRSGGGQGLDAEAEKVGIDFWFDAQ